MTREVLPHMSSRGYGQIINMSPPITPYPEAAKNKTAYMIAKFGMSMVAIGVAGEYAGKGINANCLWPATVIESSAAENFQLGSPKMWRKATILSDCVLEILLREDRNTFTGHCLIDEDYLRSKGVSDFTKYRMDPNYEPPRMNAMPSDDFTRDRAFSVEERKRLQKEYDAKL